MMLQTRGRSGERRIEKKPREWIAVTIIVVITVIGDELAMTDLDLYSALENNRELLLWKQCFRIK